MNYQWGWQIFWELSPDGKNTYIALLQSGLYWTLLTSGCAWVLAMFMGGIIGVMRTLSSPIPAYFSRWYVELFRNVPLLVQMFIWFYVLPELLPKEMGTWIKQLKDGPFITASLALGFFTSARIAEQVRTGIQALSKGQSMAGYAMGLNTAQVYRYVLLPQGLRIIIPPLGSESINLMKNSSVALTIGLVELTQQSRTMSEYTFKVFESFTAATIAYVMISLCIVALVTLTERWLRVPGLFGQKTTLH